MIEVRNLTKEFVKYEKEKGLKGLVKGFFNAKKVVKKAVDNISFTINEGEMVGYIGANGAGKSTTIKMLTGILTPTSGEVRIDGIIPYQNRVENAKKIGVVFGQRTQLWWDLPLSESFLILKEIYEMPDAFYEEQMSFFNRILNLDEFIKSPVRTLSLGQRMRADIAASLLHNPKVLYLDEPTIGLDVNAKQRMRDAIKMMNQKYNTTVILTTHDLDDIAELCNRILIIDNGKVIYDGSLHEIKEKYGTTKRIEFEVRDELNDESLNLASVFNVHPDELEITREDKKLSIVFPKLKISVAQMTEEILRRFDVQDISIFDADIERIVARIYDEGKVTL
ncbi:MAG: sugar ABC transporter ATP-binding protein [Firmicutes bacterium GWF2_51_9]|nr:ATP-binding cassette domain-containing protein [Erysipelotrichaceae bacterium]OGS54608.1 MAG: sugar ABC transporter ATP-binding protein [Firmicutes bacterium GWF2_51_9]OGS59489.1 MAG: sugar ABC transporter ATP-binding protein [Firmicutes bacterium GWE2_51_13]HAM63433.1 sugar ABC transporter ATP-binding protein [Erysipelotrichaceae bacterium]HAO61052.1 sugar ABC transporter ATP-binding protein [Erysipelotrichaceae bacterium]